MEVTQKSYLVDVPGKSAAVDMGSTTRLARRVKELKEVSRLSVSVGTVWTCWNYGGVELPRASLASDHSARILHPDIILLADRPLVRVFLYLK